MKKLKLISAVIILTTPLISLATDYQELKTAESNSQSNLGGSADMQQGFGQQNEQNIGRSIYDQNRESVSQRQQASNMKTTYFGDQQNQRNSSRSIYDQNRDNVLQRQQSFGDQQRRSLSQSSSNSAEALFEQNQ